MQKPTNAVVVSHEKESTRRLFRAVKYFIDNFPLPPQISIDNANEILFPKTNSSYYIGTAGSRAFGRGDQIHRAHLSEAAFYFDLENILAGVSEAAELGQIDIESSPNGRGNHFYDLWQSAKKGQSPYTGIFIPWFIDPEYSVDSFTEGEILGLSAMVQDMFAIPEDKFPYTSDEKSLIARVKKEYGLDLTAGQIKWRRYKIWDKGDLFFQEYPEDDVSCFLQSGRPVFRVIPFMPELKVDLERLTDEQVAVYKKKSLYGGLDGAEGNLGGDNHCFAVIDPIDGRVIFEIANTDPIEMIDARVAKLVKRLNIRLGVEKNGIGAAHVLKLKSLQCPFSVWNTTGASRPVMISELEEAYRKGELVETYSEAQNELMDIFYDNTNKAVAPEKKHDDRVFGRAIAWQTRKLPVPRVSWV